MQNLFERILKKTTAREEPAETTYMIAGLGNPGREYQGNRHNIGFMVIDRLAGDLNIDIGKYQLKALVGSGKMNQVRMILSKPQTFMNLSGYSIAPLVRFYKIPLKNLFVVYDDLDLPFGKIRLRAGGGSGGHNGISSIIQQIGTKDFPRLRFGIGRPPGRMDAASYVLQNFSREEMSFLPPIIIESTAAIKRFIESGIDEAMTHHNQMDLRG